ncbi:MAG: dTMP kinase [Desulfocapsaceae bacterium]|nr:dTMP kinase [Desulfocapsaceae bacterium]
MPSPGKLIVFEGIDGTGKSTQLSLLGQVLGERGLPVLSTCEPTDGVYGRRIRALYRNRESISRLDELQLFLADRREHVQDCIVPALAAGKIVLCDRYFLSTIAYQGAAGLDPAAILQQNSFAPVPDLALLFQAPAATGIARITGRRGEILNDFEQKDALAKVAEIFASLDYPYIRRIDATESIAAIHTAVVKAVEDILHLYQLR